MEIEKNLDDILKFLVKNNNIEVTNFHGKDCIEWKELYTEILKINPQDCLGLLEILEDDKYIEIHRAGGSSTISSISINIRGKYFISASQGGYVGKSERLNREKVELGKLQRTTISLSEKMNTLTRWIVFGSTIAAIYYLIQIFDYYIQHCPFCYPH